MIPDEDLKQMLHDFSSRLDELANSDRPLTEEEKKYRGKLLKRKQILTEVKRARDQKQKDAELFHTTVYNIMVPWGEDHPVMMFFMLIVMRMKWSSGSFIRFR